MMVVMLHGELQVERLNKKHERDTHKEDEEEDERDGLLSVSIRGVRSYNPSASGVNGSSLKEHSDHNSDDGGSSR
jgi:hypothetical protein